MAKAQPTERMLQILKRPLVTEKTAAQAEGNWVTFEVITDARKPEIRTAIERLYGVDVLQVNTLIQKGKRKGFRGVSGKRSDMKKAFIKVKDGQSIDVAAGL
ncbi:MAG: 50S ribosomal protein L23 [Alphaproteobacteria bacterium]|nr:50S ribosomal protein L23 [Alphaproteobacteria bacterium]MDD9919509.1 50S ribosomal protein L23 [Alphaproteobacteria bacterium]